MILKIIFLIFFIIFFLLLRIKLERYVRKPIDDFKAWIYHQIKVKKRKKVGRK